MSELKFEDKIKKIEEIADKLDNNEIGIDELLKQYEDGIKLVEECRKYLDEAEQKITDLSNRESN